MPKWTEDRRAKVERAWTVEKRRECGIKSKEILKGIDLSCKEGCICNRHIDHRKIKATKKCVVGCLCKKHLSRPGHSKCIEGCTCARHTNCGGVPCPIGCTCYRHSRVVSEITRQKQRVAKLGKKQSPEIIKKRFENRDMSHFTERRWTTMQKRYGLVTGPLFDTKPERQVKAILDAQKIEYRAQCLLEGILVDIFIPKLNLVIEVDGCWWHGHCCVPSQGELRDWQSARQKSDLAHTQKLMKANYAVLRVWECEIKKGIFLNIFTEMVSQIQ